MLVLFARAFDYFADGNFYHGYDVKYFVLPKKAVLEQLSYYLLSVHQICHPEKTKFFEIPFAIFDDLEVDPDIKVYDPPIRVGEGIDYL